MAFSDGIFTQTFSGTQCFCQWQLQMDISHGIVKYSNRISIWVKRWLRHGILLSWLCVTSDTFAQILSNCSSSTTTDKVEFCICVLDAPWEHWLMPFLTEKGGYNKLVHSLLSPTCSWAQWHVKMIKSATVMTLIYIALLEKENT